MERNDAELAKGERKSWATPELKSLAIGETAGPDGAYPPQSYATPTLLS